MIECAARGETAQRQDILRLELSKGTFTLNIGEGQLLDHTCPSVLCLSMSYSCTGMTYSLKASAHFLSSASACIQGRWPYGYCSAEPPVICDPG